MRAVCGEVNDTCYLSFSVEIQGTKNTSELWTGEKSLIKGSNATTRGKFKSLKENYELAEQAYINYKDFVNNVQIVVTENRLSPMTEIRIGLPSPERYHMSEFFVRGHLEIVQINVISQAKTIQGVVPMNHIREGKTVNLLDKLYMKKIGDALLIADQIETELGVIHHIRSKANIEI